MACFAICFGFALGSNMIAICSNTTVYVGVTIFALGGPVGVLVGFEATRFWSATGGRTFDRDRLLSASRVPMCRVATLVSTATAGRGPLPIASAKKHHTLLAASNLPCAC